MRIIIPSDKLTIFKRTIMEISKLEISCLTEENEFKALHETIANLQLELTQVQDAFQRDSQQKDHVIKSLEEIISMKEEANQRLLTKQDQEKDFALIYELEEKLQKAENEVSKLERENLALIKQGNFRQAKIKRQSLIPHYEYVSLRQISPIFTEEDLNFAEKLGKIGQSFIQKELKKSN